MPVEFMDKLTLWLPDGRDAGRVRLGELLRTLLSLKCPNIDGSMNKLQLLEAYRAFLIPLVLKHMRPRLNYRGSEIDPAIVKKALAEVLP